MTSVIFLCSLVLLGLTNTVTSEEYEEDPALPELPEQWYMNIEINHKLSNTTSYLKEFYDGPGNRGAILKFADNRNYLITYDLSNLQAIIATWVQGVAKCNVRNLTNNSTFYFLGFDYEGGNVHINSTTGILHFGKQFNETYVGLDEVRGIPVDHWMASQSHENGSSIDLHYYFSIKGYHTATNGSQIPVRVTLNESSTTIIDTVVDFFNVHWALPWWERAFELPLGMSCVGRKSRKELPKLPNTFSLRGEWIGTRRKKINSFTAHYNYPGNMTAFTFHMLRSGSTSSMKLVHDFNYGLAYMINEEVGSCNVSAINVTAWFPSPDVVLAPDGSHVFQQDPSSFFIPPNLTWAYEGKSTLRGMEVESWISEPHDTHSRKNLTTEVFFASVNYSSTTYPSYVTHFPVQRIERGGFFNRTTGRNESHQAIINVFAFDHDVSRSWYFDISDCMDEEDQIPLAFDLAGSENFHKYFQNNTRNFNIGAHNSIAKAARLPGSRVTHLQVEEGTNEVLSIFFTLLGVPKIQGNAVNSSQNHSIPVKDAKENLQKAIDGKSLVICIQLQGEMKSLQVVKGSLRQDFSYSEPKTSSSNVGGTAAVAIVTFITGLFIGAILVIVVQKKCTSDIPYHLQP